MFEVIQPYLGLSFAIILSFASLENKLYSKNYIKENIKYISIKIVFSILYVIAVWSIVFHTSTIFPFLQLNPQLNLKFVVSYSFWIAIILFVLHLWINEKLSGK